MQFSHKAGRGLVLALAFALSSAADGQSPAKWSGASIDTLKRWIQAAPNDALPALETRSLDRAIAFGETAAIDQAADALALKLARLHLLGASSAKSGWNIPDSDREIDLAGRLDRALASAALDAFFSGLDPVHPDYAALRSAWLAEKDPARRTQLARNMERWRWLPRSLGDSYLMVNTAAFEVSLYRHGQRVDTRAVINGKKSTPTPTFSATVTGVTFNPWWEIPPSIVRESIGSLVRRNPALARQRGYVWSGGRYRQKPGPGNALGLMKLVMPNPYKVYLHDTPSKNLFANPVRAYSHGCIRVSDALGFAAMLLEGTKTREQVDAIVATGVTQTVSLAGPMPVYIAYFTAGTRPDGTLAYYPDIYGRDRNVRIAFRGETECSGMG